MANDFEKNKTKVYNINKNNIKHVIKNINSWCNVVHTKESYAEAIRIIQSEPTLTIHNVPSFTLGHPIIVFLRNTLSGMHVLSGLYLPDCTISFRPVVCTTKKTFFKRFGRWSSVKTRFLTGIDGLPHVF